jgi:hypothetical protein
MAKEPDLLEELDDDFNLLDTIEEDSAEGWVPEKVGEGLQGVVTKVSETKSDFSDEMAPTVTVETKDGSTYRVIGYGAVLGREIRDADPKPGDLFAVKYFGEKAIKKGKWAGKNYKHYGVVVRHRS